MIFFYFNDCITKNETAHNLTVHLQNVLGEFNEVKKQYSDEIESVITEKEPFNTFLNSEGFTLGECINNLEPQSKRLAYSVFNKYPIDSIFNIEEKEIEELIDEDFSLFLNPENLSATNLAIAYLNKGTLFTLPTHNHLKKNEIVVNGKTQSITLNNLYGFTTNTNFIKQQIENEKNGKLNSFDKLLSIIGKNVYSDRFKRGFNSLTKIMQERVIDNFEIAKKRNGLTNFYSDEELIKDVTPNGETEIKVFELRIFKPVAYRVYFHETSDLVYLAMIEKKPPKKVQNTHITSSQDIIKELRITKR